jgi:hypothetical protein
MNIGVKKKRFFLINFLIILVCVVCILFFENIQKTFFAKQYWNNKVSVLKKNYKVSKGKLAVKKIILEQELADRDFQKRQVVIQSQVDGKNLDESLKELSVEKKERIIRIQEEIKDLQMSVDLSKKHLEDALLDKNQNDKIIVTH